MRRIRNQAAEKRAFQGERVNMESKTPQRIEAVFEVLVAGFGGWVLVVLFLVITGLKDSEMLSRPVWMAAVLNV